MIKPGKRRFIPTYMGNALTSRIGWLPCAVHPHVHGERFMIIWGTLCMGGSSPRTWGTLRERRLRRRKRRFIPTYMGNAAGVDRPPPTPPVHPHVHGERVAYATIVYFITGSSPRTWGTRTRAPVRLSPERFIPTYMGNATRRRRRVFGGTVHPHVHGERMALAVSVIGAIGSSPRTWGTPQCLR